jgi:hypothetical protein
VRTGFVPGYGFTSSYRAVVSADADANGGQAFVTDYAQPTATLIDEILASPLPGADPTGVNRDALVELLRGSDYVTRLYARMSAEEMTRDPYFEPADPEAGDVGRMREQPAESDCNAPPVCELIYCGREGVCVAEGDPALPTCVCRDGATARGITTGPIFLPHAYCEPLSVSFSAPEEQGVCDGIDCGLGRCVPANGNPSCICEPGAGAQVAIGSATADVTCVAVTGELPDFPVLPPIPALTPFGADDPLEVPIDDDAEAGATPTTTTPMVDRVAPRQPTQPAADVPESESTNPQAEPASPPQGSATGSGGDAALCSARAPGATRHAPAGVLAVLLLTLVTSSRAQRRRQAADLRRVGA